MGLYLATFLLQLGQGAVIPLLPVLVGNTPAGIGPEAVGIAVASFGLARLAASLPAGVLAGRIGPTWLIVTGPLLMAVALFGLAGAHDLPEIVGWRLLAGVSSALFVTASLIYLGEASDVSRRGSAYAYFYVAFSAGISAGPALGGILAELGGPSVPLMVVGFTSIASACLAFLTVPSIGRPSATGETSGLGRWAAWRDPAFLAVALLSLLLYATRNGTQQTVVPTAALSQGLGIVIVGIGFTLAAIVTSVSGAGAAYLLDRFPRVRLMYIGCGLLGVTILGWIPGVQHAALFLGTMAAYGLISALTDSATVTVASELPPGEARPRAIGYFRLVSDGGYVLGPLAFGAVAGFLSPAIAVTTNAVLLVGASAAGLLGRRVRLR
jgi:MFS family permease